MNQTITNAMSNGGGLRWISTLITIVGTFVGVGVWVNSNISALGSQITINKVITDHDIDKLREAVEDEEARIDKLSVDLSSKIVGRTPEGFHRQDAKELSDAICDEIREKRPDADCIDPYDLPRYKRAIEQIRRR